VFIRIRKNKRDIQQILSKNQIEYIEENNECFSMHANVKLDELLAPADYVIQDIASQQTGHFFEPHAKERWWDCCTASGGKSIMLLDKQPNIQLTVSDVRDSILKSLHHRFSQYNYQSKYVSHSIDLSQPVTQFPSNYFDQIICDVPCSGSGTWARSPEQYYFFTEEKLNEFHSKQLVIASEALQKLKPGGTLYYITCSVFEQEKLLLRGLSKAETFFKKINQAEESYFPKTKKLDNIFYEISHKKLKKSNPTICFWNSVPQTSDESLEIDKTTAFDQVSL
jgi:16S rRNA (cytosine967-C5)-methyltransferase